MVAGAGGGRIWPPAAIFGCSAKKYFADFNKILGLRKNTQ
jgi:hypothetical protein